MAQETKLQPSTILVIDDDPEIRECIGVALEEDGMSANYASDMDAGISVARQLHPDIILLDYLMTWPVEPTEIARLRVAAGDPLVILMTASRDHHSFRTLGVDRLLLKPFNVDNLLQAVTER